MTTNRHSSSSGLPVSQYCGFFVKTTSPPTDHDATANGPVPMGLANRLACLASCAILGITDAAESARSASSGAQGVASRTTTVDGSGASMTATAVNRDA